MEARRGLGKVGKVGVRVKPDGSVEAGGQVNQKKGEVVKLLTKMILCLTFILFVWAVIGAGSYFTLHYFNFFPPDKLILRESERFVSEYFSLCRTSGAIPDDNCVKTVIAILNLPPYQPGLEKSDRQFPVFKAYRDLTQFAKRSKYWNVVISSSTDVPTFSIQILSVRSLPKPLSYLRPSYNYCIDSTGNIEVETIYDRN